MENEQYVETWEGHIQYGDYSGSFWYGLQSTNNPIWRWIEHRLKTEVPHRDIFEMWVSGSILEYWTSWDVDVFIFGEYFPEKIKESLDAIVRIGFEENVFLDASYQDKPWPIHQREKWIINPKRQEDEDDYACYELSNVFIKNGIPKDMSWAKPYDGLFKRVKVLPFDKHLAMPESFVYKEPLIL